MTTSFRARFPVGAIKNLRVFNKGPVLPADWAKSQLSGPKIGDIIVCFNPFSTNEGAAAELEASAIILVFNADQSGVPLGLLLTDEWYVVGTTEAIFRERAVAASARGNNFSFVTIPYTGVLTDESRKFITSMQRWGSGGTRANPTHGLPDPLVAFFACIGVALPASPPVGIGAVAEALVRGRSTPPVPALNNKFMIAMRPAADAPAAQSIASVTIVENQQPADAAGPASGAQAKPALPGAETGTAGLKSDSRGLPSAAAEPKPATGLGARSGEQKPAAGFAPAARAESIKEAPSGVTQVGQRSGERPSVQPPPAPLPSEPARPTEPAAPTTPSTSAGSSAAGTASGGSESGFLSIRKRLEARLSGRLSKPSVPAAPGETPLPSRAEPSSPVVKLVSNIRQQMSIASDNLEYRVSTLKSKMLDRLVSCKHNLSEKEQLNLKALEDLRTAMLNKLELSATNAREELSRTSSQGIARVREFQANASGRLAEMLAEQEKAIITQTETARNLVNTSLSATRDELNKTVSRAQHSLRGLVTTTEVNLNQVINQCGESMDERIDGFRAQTQILAEGIGLSVESLGEAAKLQAQQSEEEVTKRLEALSEESVKSLREQSVKAEMECSKLIDKLSREKLVPTLQDKRKIVVELSEYYHEELTATMGELFETNIAEFEPIVRSNADALSSSLQDFKSRWTTNLEQHQKDLDEIEVKLKDKVDEHLASARSRIESMQDITKVTDHVLTSPELIRTRDEIMLKFDIVSREHVSRAYSLTGDQVQTYKQESLDELAELRESSETLIKNRGEESRNRIRVAVRNAMQKIQDLQSKYTA